MQHGFLAASVLPSNFKIIELKSCQLTLIDFHEQIACSAQILGKSRITEQTVLKTIQHFEMHTSQIQDVHPLFAVCVLCRLKVLSQVSFWHSKVLHLHNRSPPLPFIPEAISSFCSHIQHLSPFIATKLHSFDIGTTFCEMTHLSWLIIHFACLHQCHTQCCCASECFL